MKLDTNTLIRKFTDTIKKQYPDLSSKDINDIVKSQFESYAEHIGSGKLVVIRAKYFGTFIPYPNRVKGMLKLLTAKFKKNNMSEKKYLEMKNNLENYLNDKEY